jgi:GDP-L-fucose synthase
LKVLVTGAAGMLGGNVVQAFQSAGTGSVLGVTRDDLDLRDAEALAALLKETKPDLVVHAAAMVGGIQANIKNPFDFLHSNLSMDANVVQSCVAAGVQKLIYLGSSCMYPKNFRQPLVETDVLAAPLEPTNEGYAIAKIAGSKLCEYASESFGLNYKTIIPSNLYGPGDNFNPGSSHLLASVIRKVHQAKESGSDGIDVWGSGGARREFTFVGDLASWVAASVDDIESLPPLLNLGIGVDYSIDEFYLAAMKIIGYQVPLIHDPTKPEGMMAKLMDSSLAKTHHGWNPTTALTQGIEKTYRWFIERQETGARL